MKTITVRDEVDVLVCGGGPAGVAAAVSAARNGARTLVVEQQGCFGGTATSAMVAAFIGGYSRDAEKRLVCGGVHREIVERLRAKQMSHSTGTVDYVHIEGLKKLCDELVLGAGARVLFFTSTVEPLVENGVIQGVVVHNKSGLGIIKARMVVDCTGDGDIAAAVGCRFEKGRPANMEFPGEMAPATLRSLMTGVDTNAIAAYVKETGDRRFRTLVQKLRDQDEWPANFLFDMICMEPSDITMGLFGHNILRQCGVDGTDPESMTKGMIEGRAMNAQMTELLRKHFPGFSNARLVATAPVIGIRDTRRIMGVYRLTVEDLVNGRSFADTIALSGYGWDLPHPRQPSYQEMLKSWRHTEDSVGFRKPYSEIPYRCLITKEHGNLLVAGRCISVEYHALGPVRIMPACFATGEAAGTAAALAVSHSVAVQDLDPLALRETLAGQGVILS